jgi:hypothetical protein
MTALQPLLPAALVGTERHAGQAPTGGHRPVATRGCLAG